MDNKNLIYNSIIKSSIKVKFLHSCHKGLPSIIGIMLTEAEHCSAGTSCGVCAVGFVPGNRMMCVTCQLFSGEGFLSDALSARQ